MSEFTSMFNEYGVPNHYEATSIDMIMELAMKEVLNRQSVIPRSIIEMEYLAHAAISSVCAEARIKAQTKMRKAK
jgi:hypothetical protein